MRLSKKANYTQRNRKSMSNSRLKHLTFFSAFNAFFFVLERKAFATNRIDNRLKTIYQMYQMNG